MGGGWVERRFRCGPCNKRFTTKSARTRHMQEFHSDEPRFACPQCLKSFARKYELNDHINVVHDSVPIQCSLCHKKFSTSRAFRIHYNRFHSHSYKHTCLICNKRFNIKYYFQRHIETCGMPTGFGRS